MIAPATKDKNAIKDTRLASHPCNLLLLNHLSPSARNKKIIPANEMYIFSIDKDIYFIPLMINSC